MESIPPIKRFGRGDRVYVQAQQVWLILVAFIMQSKAQNRPAKAIRMTYGELAEAMGYSDRRAGHILSRQLWTVGTLCVQNDLPPLNAIVVEQTTNVPGHGVVLRPGRSLQQEQAAVTRENWFGIRVPTTGTFRKVYATL